MFGVLGRRHGESVLAANSTRAPGTDRNARRAARFINAGAGSGSSALTFRRRAVDRYWSGSLRRELDAIVAAFMHARVGSTAGLSPPAGWRVVSPAAGDTEAGALTACLSRLDPAIAWPVSSAARKACGGSVRRLPGNDRVKATEVQPADLGDYITSLYANHTVDVDFSRQDMMQKIQPLAAASLAAFAGGLPIGMIGDILTADVSIRSYAARNDAVSFLHRGLRKVVRRTALEDEADMAPVTPLAGCSPVLALYFAPYVLEARRLGWARLFPCLLADGTPSPTRPIQGATISAVIHHCVPGGTTHGIRAGVRRALGLVHLVYGGPKRPVADVVKNAIQARSNAAAGSGDLYDLSLRESIWDACNSLHKVRWAVDGGFTNLVRPDRVRVREGKACLACGRSMRSMECAWACEMYGCRTQMCWHCAPFDPGSFPCHPTASDATAPHLVADV